MRNFLYTTALFLLLAGHLAAQPLNVRKVSSPLLVRETRGFTESPDGTLYFFTGNDNIYRIQDDTLVVAVEYDCPSSCVVQDIYAGPDSALYVGTKFGGLLRIKDGVTTGFIPDKNVYCVAADTAGKLYAGIDGAGIGVYNGATWTYYKNAGTNLASDFINDLAIDTNHVLWLATGAGLAKYTGSGNNFTNYTLSGFGPSYSSVEIGADNKVWATASSGGAVGFDGTEWTTFPDIFTFISGVNGLGVSSTGVVWTSRSSHGLYRVQTAPTVQGTLYPFDTLNLGTGSILRSMFMDSRDQLWVCLDFSTDLAVITENPVSGATETRPYQGHFRVYPNPVRGDFHLECSAEAAALAGKTAVLINALGQRIAAWQLTDGQTIRSLEAGGFAPGLYTLRLEQAGQTLAVERVVRME